MKWILNSGRFYHYNHLMMKIIKNFWFFVYTNWIFFVYEVFVWRDAYCFSGITRFGGLVFDLVVIFGIINYDTPLKFMEVS